MAPRWGGEGFRYQWEELVPELDKLVMMYWGELLSFEEIAQATGKNWWTIKELFKAYQVPRMTLTDRARYKKESEGV